MTTDRNDDISRDELRREMRAAAVEHDQALPGWRRAVQRVLDPSSAATDAEKASVLGVPPRRMFMVGGVVVAGGALLAACKKSSNQTPLTGELPTPPSTTTTTAPGSAANDEVLLRTAQSIEVLAVQTYQKALDANILEDQSFIEMAKLFQGQHQEHADALTTPIRAMGGQPVTEPNEYLLTNQIDKEVSDLAEAKDVLTLFRDVENIAAQTYTEAGGVLTTGDLRQSAMSIGAVEARHITVWNVALGYSPVPLPFMPTRLAIDPKGYVAS
jgi:hypothetical protein